MQNCPGRNHFVLGKSDLEHALEWTKASRADLRKLEREVKMIDDDLRQLERLLSNIVSIEKEEARAV